MRPEIRRIVGKTISGVIVKESEREPRSQVFLLFAGGTYYELYSGAEIHGTGGPDPGGVAEVRAYLLDAARVVFEAVSDEGRE